MLSLTKSNSYIMSDNSKHNRNINIGKGYSLRAHKIINWKLPDTFVIVHECNSIYPASLYWNG